MLSLMPAFGVGHTCERLSNRSLYAEKLRARCRRHPYLPKCRASMRQRVDTVLCGPTLECMEGLRYPPTLSSRRCLGSSQMTLGLYYMCFRHPSMWRYCGSGIHAETRALIPLCSEYTCSCVFYLPTPYRMHDTGLILPGRWYDMNCQIQDFLWDPMPSIWFTWYR